jgi:hypothetical protein
MFGLKKEIKEVYVSLGKNLELVVNTIKFLDGVMKTVTTLSKNVEILNLKLEYFGASVIDLRKDVEELKRKRDPDSDFSKRLKKVTPKKH